jgi:hypothetical protein
VDDNYSLWLLGSPPSPDYNCHFGAQINYFKEKTGKLAKPSACSLISQPLRSALGSLAFLLLSYGGWGRGVRHPLLSRDM